MIALWCYWTGSHDMDDFEEGDKSGWFEKGGKVKGHRSRATWEGQGDGKIRFYAVPETARVWVP